MPYATQQQLIDRYGQSMLVALTDRGEPPSEAIDADVVARALAGADALIDGYLAGLYALPMASTPPMLEPIAQAIAIYDLHITEPEKKIQNDYDNALKRLSEISKGIIQLKDAAGIEPAAPQGGGVQITDRERAFTPDTMTGFI
jgi:phage gp36-like protein